MQGYGYPLARDSDLNDEGISETPRILGECIVSSFRLLVTATSQYVVRFNGAQLLLSWVFAEDYEDRFRLVRRVLVGLEQSFRRVRFDLAEACPSYHEVLRVYSYVVMPV